MIENKKGVDYTRTWSILELMSDIIGKNQGYLPHNVEVDNLSKAKVFSMLNQYNKENKITLLRRENILYNSGYYNEIYSFNLTTAFGSGIKVYVGASFRQSIGKDLVNDKLKDDYKVDLYFLWLSELACETDLVLELIKELYASCKYIAKKSLAKIGIIISTRTGLDINEIDISKKISPFEDLDLHYGEGFNEFYGKMVETLTSKDSGLLLLHGITGTGKTVCIRNLIKDTKNKLFVYVPKNVLDNIMAPEIISFLINYSSDRQKNNIVLILEDAEDMVRARDDFQGTSVSNILNLTDGLLNDVLNMQIICTFNTSEENIDKALLRNGRLLIRKEFKRLDKNRSKQLLDKIGKTMDIPADGLTLAEIYSTQTGEPLIHQYEEIKKSDFGFIL